MKALAEGGNAIDAAIATVAALNVVEPHASGLGGGGFLLYYDAKLDSFYVIDYRERAPAKLQLADYFQKSDTLKLVQRMGAKAVAVPGSAAGWQAMHDRFGTRVLADLMAPAISYADTGFAITEKLATQILDHIEEIQSDSAMASTFLVGGLPAPAGTVLKQPALAKFLKFLSRTRLDNFYHPPIAKEVVGTIATHGGTLSTSDLASYSIRDRKPVRGFYHGYEIITLPPPSSGGTAVLEILKLVEKSDLKSMGHLSADYIHTLASATRQALTDGGKWVGDPDFARVPTEKMLSEEWLETARSRMRSDSASEIVTPLDSIRAFGPGNTTHLVIADSMGNLVSLTQSINYFFGAALMVPEHGLLLNNHMGDFASDTTGISGIAPRHRPPSNMAATIVRKDGKPVLVIGSPGGPRIAPALAQVIIDVLDFSLPLNEALDAPRFYPSKKTLVVESRIAKETLNNLSGRGWKIYPNSALNNFFGGVNAIYFDPQSGAMTGAADPRRDGVAAGY